MDGKKSKFTSGSFYGDTQYFAVNRDKFTKEEAIQMCRNETGYDPYEPFKAEVWFGCGVDEDGQARAGCWWLDVSGTGKRPRRCPVWAMEVGYEEVSL